MKKPPLRPMSPEPDDDFSWILDNDLDRSVDDAQEREQKRLGRDLTPVEIRQIQDAVVDDYHEKTRPTPLS